MCSSHVAAWAPLFSRLPCPWAAASWPGHACCHTCCVSGLPCSFLCTPVCWLVISILPPRDGSSLPACWLSVSYGCHVVACARPFTHLPPSNGIVTMPSVSLHSPVGAHSTAQGRHTSVGVRLFPCLRRSRDTMCWHRRLCSPASCVTALL